jgi:tRNA-splicing ligase RtcB
MNCAANFAFANRQLITFWIREAMKEIFSESEINILYDVCHNIAKIEEHLVDGKIKKVCVHRKGATRSFGTGRKEIPTIYRKVGQPVLIPGSMGTASYILVGTKKAEELTFGSTAHGAGRAKSRMKALKEFKCEEIKKELLSKNIEIKTGNLKSLAEEAPEAYKNIDEIVKIVDEEGLSKKIVKLRPLIVIKG